MSLHRWRSCIASVSSIPVRYASSTASSRARIYVPPPVPIIEKCPSPSCACRATPPDLDIDRNASLNGTMAAYSNQVLICTGKDDWKSRIDEEEDAELVRGLRGVIGQGGKFFDPFNNVMLTNSSFKPSTQTASSAYLFPSFQYVPNIPHTPSSIQTFASGFLKSKELHFAHNTLKDEAKKLLTREPALQSEFPDTLPVRHIVVLICGHGGRDARCGILGPLLKTEFEEKLQAKGIALAPETPTATEDAGLSARVGLISHIGGHKYAGNVIIYLPPSLSENGLKGTGIWYGRVGPEHVEGIIKETIGKGRVIKEFFRGGLKQSGELIRI